MAMGSMIAFLMATAKTTAKPKAHMPEVECTSATNAVAGAKIFASSGCTACHTYLGTGSSNQGAPDLSAEGTKGHTKDFFMSYIRDPSKFGNNVMPKFGFDDQQLSQLATFLLASKGPK